MSKKTLNFEFIEKEIRKKKFSRIIILMISQIYDTSIILRA